MSGTFTSAPKAIEFIEQNKVDVVLSDIQMPDMNGIELCDKLQSDPDIQIVLFSSYQNYDYFRSAIQYAVSDYLLKPVSYATLLECFSRLREKLDTMRHTNIKKQEQPEGYYEQMIKLVEDYLSSHIQDATLTRCAERVNLSPSYLSRMLTVKSGLSFSDRLLTLRMERACEILSDPKYKSYDVAFDIGYDNPKNFSRAFKNYWSKTPSEFRQQAKRGVKK